MFTLCILKNYNIRKNCYHTMLPAGAGGARAWSGIEGICCESFWGGENYSLGGGEGGLTEGYKCAKLLLNLIVTYGLGAHGEHG